MFASEYLLMNIVLSLKTINLRFCAINLRFWFTLQLRHFHCKLLLLHKLFVEKVQWVWCETKPVLFPKNHMTFIQNSCVQHVMSLPLHSDCFLFLQLEMEDDDVIEVYQEQTGGQ